MATVIESLVVELGLDASKFNLQQREAFETAKRLEDQQLKAAKNVEYGAERAGTALAGVRTQALQMLAVLTGGAGVVRFAANLTNADAALGRLQRNINISSSTISAWQGAARIFGGDAQSMAQSFTTISDAFAGWKIGMVSPLIADLRAISTAGGKVIDVNKGVEQSMLDLSENLKKIHDSGPEGPQTAAVLGRRVGLDPALYDLMIQGPEKLSLVLDYVKKIGVATKEDTDAFGELEKRINQMGVKAEALGRQILGGKDGIASYIMRLADWLSLKPGEAGKQFMQMIGASPSAPAGSTEAKASPGYGTLFGGPGGSTTPTGAFVSQAEKEQFIRSEAAKRGINPNVAMAVARSEGFNNFVSTIPGETSYGAYQLNVSPGGRKGHVGDQFRAKTGLDPADPRNERAGIAFALDDVKRNGWAAYHGAKNTGISRWQGVNEGPSSTSTTEVNINGPITITPPAGVDPKAWSAEFADAIKRQAFTAQANAGQQ